MNRIYIYIVKGSAFIMMFGWAKSKVVGTQCIYIDWYDGSSKEPSKIQNACMHAFNFVQVVAFHSFLSQG